MDRWKETATHIMYIAACTTIQSSLQSHVNTPHGVQYGRRVPSLNSHGNFFENWNCKYLHCKVRAKGRLAGKCYATGGPIKARCTYMTYPPGITVHRFPNRVRYKEAVDRIVRCHRANYIFCWLFCSLCLVIGFTSFNLLVHVCLSTEDVVVQAHSISDAD